MPSEIAQAFDHPDARAAATAGAEPLDRISLRDHIVEVEIGAFQAERGTTQRVCFNVVVEVRPVSGELGDDVDKILSYDKVTEAIADALAEERLNLLETLAERIAERILWEPQAQRVFVRIEKLDRGPGALGVEIVRANEAGQEEHHEEERPHPVVAYFSNEAIASGNVSAWVDQLAAREEPLLICVGMSETPVPEAGAVMAQRRIDLLAIEQNAWVLAGQDKRCVVVGTRTELEWAIRNGQISVWAPSKMVLDAVDGPSAAKGDALALALWFASELEAAKFVALGDALPEIKLDIPVETVGTDQRDI